MSELGRIAESVRQRLLERILDNIVVKNKMFRRIGNLYFYVIELFLNKAVFRFLCVKAVQKI